MARAVPLRPHAGTFVGRDGQTRSGVMLMRGGRWRGSRGWVGGEQVAVVTWRRGRLGSPTELYKRVRAARCSLLALRKDTDVAVHVPEETR